MPKRNIRMRLKEAAHNYCCSAEVWKDRFPITRWLPKYRPGDIVNDVIAGLTVGLTVLPQALAYANIAKLPLVYGLYSAFMGSFIYCLLGMSKDITVGPTAIMSLLVASYGVPDKNNPEQNDPRYAVLLAFFCGLSQILFGVLHLGFVTNYISAVVISGFTSASALIIGFGQIKNILGIRYHSENFTGDLINLINNFDQVKWGDCAMGVTCIVILALLRMVKNKSQSSLGKLTSSSPWHVRALWKTIWIIGTARNAVIVVLSSAVAYWLIQTGHPDAVVITGNITQGLPPFQAPDFQAPKIFGNLNVGLVVIPLIGFLESIAIAKVFARQNGYRVESNQELIALGVCNTAGSFVNSYPTTGSFSRSAINSQSSVVSPLGGLVTGSLVLLSLAYLTPQFYYIPKSALSAVIVFSVVFMVDYQIILQLWRVKKWELLTLAATFFPSLHLGVEYGTMIGIGVDVMMMLFPMANPGYKVETDTGTSALVIRFKYGLRYPAAERLRSVLDDEALMIDKPRSVILDMAHVIHIDYSIAMGLKNCLKSFRKEGQDLALVNLKPSVRSILERSKFDEDVIFESEEAAREMMRKVYPPTDQADNTAFDSPL